MATLPDTHQINENIKKPGTWKRILFMLLFAVIVGFVRVLLWAIVLFQVLSSLLTGSQNPNATELGRVIALYLYQILLFLTFATDEMPFPFADWEKTRQGDPLQSKNSDS